MNMAFLSAAYFSCARYGPIIIAHAKIEPSLDTNSRIYASEAVF